MTNNELAEKEYPYLVMGGAEKWVVDAQRAAFIRGLEWKGGDGNDGMFKIAFTDCWEMDERIDADQRWLAVNDRLKIVVTAPTKEQAFEEVMISIKVMCAYESKFELKEPNYDTIRKKMNEYFANVDPKEIIAKFEEMGYTFVPTIP